MSFNEREGHFCLLDMLACVASTLVNADEDEHGHSLMLIANTFEPDQPETDNNRLFMKA